MRSPMTVALYGATGALGREILSCLEDSPLRFQSLTLYASMNTAGDELLFGSKILKVHLTPEEPPAVDLAILALPKEVSAELAPKLLEVGAKVLDANPSDDVSFLPKVLVPSVNGGAVSKDAPYLASPSQGTVALALALKPMVDALTIRSVVTTVLESAAGAGQRGMETLSKEILDLYRRGEVSGGDEDDEDEGEVETSTHLHQLAFNAVPQVGELGQGGWTQAEADLRRDIPLLLGQDVPVSATVIRAPWFSSHALSVTVILDGSPEPKAINALFESAGSLLEVRKAGAYPMPFQMVGQDVLALGRLRVEGNRVSFWLVGDNLRALGALNVVNCVAWMMAAS